MCKSLNEQRRYLENHSGATVVEVAVIVPMIWIIVMGSILLLFFFFDMGVIRSETIRSADEVAQEWKEEKHRTVSEEKSRLKHRINERLILTKLQTASVMITYGSVTVKAEVRFHFAGRGLNFVSTAKAALDNREQWMRILYKGDEGDGD